MKNPLFKRLKREFKHDIVKYIVMFLFLMLPIALCAGYMVGNDSMIKTYYESFNKYNLEDGHFVLKDEINDNLKTKIENNESITIYNLNYKDELTNNSHNYDKWALRQAQGP